MAAGKAARLALCSLLWMGAGSLHGALELHTPGARVQQVIGAKSATSRRGISNAEALLRTDHVPWHTGLPPEKELSNPAGCATRHLGRRWRRQIPKNAVPSGFGVGGVQALALGVSLRLRGGVASPASRKTGGSPITVGGAEISKKKTRNKKLPSRAREKVWRHLSPQAWQEAYIVFACGLTGRYSARLRASVSVAVIRLQREGCQLLTHDCVFLLVIARRQQRGSVLA